MSTLSITMPLHRRLSRLVPAPRAVRKLTRTDRPLSWSACRAYADCSLQWRLAREGAPESVASGLLFSGAFRAALFHYYRLVREGRDVPAGELLDVFERQWVADVATAGGAPIHWGATEKDAAHVRVLAARMIDAFFAERGRRGRTEVVAVAEPFRVEVGGGVPPVAGVIDLVEIRLDEDGVRRLHLVRFKIASRRCTLDELGFDTLHLFALAACGMGLAQIHRLPLSLRWDQFTKTKNPEIIPLAVNDFPSDFGRLAESIRQRWHGMTAGVCFPAPSWRCASCGFRQACARWPSSPATTRPLPSVREDVPA